MGVVYFSHTLYSAALEMNYRYYIFILSFFSSIAIWPVTAEESDSLPQKEKLKHIPNIPELSANIKDPSKWKNGTRLIFFYSPWCEHSNSLRPLLYDVIEEIYYKNVTDIWISQMDVSVKTDVARTFRIKSTPTLLLFKNGTRYEFDDDHTVEKIVSFIISIMSPSLSEVHYYSQIKELKTQHSVLFCLIYDEDIDPDWEAVYTQVSIERILIAKFIYTLNTSIPQQLGLTLPSLPRLLVIKENSIHQYTDTLTKYRMTLWVENEQFPALPFVNRTTFRPIVAIGNSKRLLILFVSTIKNIPLNQKKAVEAVRRVAESRKLHSGYQCVVLDDQDLIYRMTGVQLPPPSLFVWDKKSGMYYLFDPSTQGGYTDKSISSFLFSITSGKITESGGPSMSSTLTSYYWLAYNLLQAMISHRPLLSVFTIVCLCLGITICVYTKMQSKKNQEFQRKLNARRIIRRKAKEQQQTRERREQQPIEDQEDNTDGEETGSQEEEETDKNK